MPIPYCHICGKTLEEIGGYLTRANEKGVAAIWKCAPSCSAQQTQEENLMQALEAADYQEWIKEKDND